MPKIVAFLSQKGGVGKSTLARAFAREAANSDLAVKVADLDIQQGTFVDWHRQREANGHQRIGSVETFAKAADALRSAEGFDLLIIDGAPRASKATLEIAKRADITVLPSCASRDDLIPAVRLAKDLVGQGIDANKLVFALCRVTTEAEIRDARDFIETAGYHVLTGALVEKPAYRNAQNIGLSVTETRFAKLNERADELLTDLTNTLLAN